MIHIQLITLPHLHEIVIGYIDSFRNLNLYWTFIFIPYSSCDLEISYRLPMSDGSSSFFFPAPIPIKLLSGSSTWCLSLARFVSLCTRHFSMPHCSRTSLLGKFSDRPFSLNLTDIPVIDAFFESGSFRIPIHHVSVSGFLILRAMIRRSFPIVLPQVRIWLLLCSDHWFWSWKTFHTDDGVCLSSIFLNRQFLLNMNASPIYHFFLKFLPIGIDISSINPVHTVPVIRKAFL